MKQVTLIIVFFLAFCSSYSQGDPKFDHWVDWNTVQLTKSMATDDKLRELNRTYQKKYPTGISQQQYSDLVGQIKQAEDYYRFRATGVKIFQQGVSSTIDIFLPSGWKGIIPKVAKSVIGENLDLSKVETDRIDERKMEVTSLIAGRLAASKGNMDATIDDLKNSEQGKYLANAFGNDIFEKGRQAYEANKKNTQV